MKYNTAIVKKSRDVLTFSSVIKIPEKKKANKK